MHSLRDGGSSACNGCVRVRQAVANGARWWHRPCSLRPVLPAIQRKLLRDLVRLKGQTVTIAFVIAAGIASFIALQGNYASLQQARASFYERLRFADTFASLESAPLTLIPKLENIPGIERVETRIVEPATIPLPEVAEPLRARIVSLDDSGNEALNVIALRDGRRPESDHPDEAVLLAGFADAHGLVPGDTLPAIINGKKKLVRIVGTALSPEYVLAATPGSTTADPDRFAVLWMSARTLRAAFAMEGAFNDVAVTLSPGASEAGVIDALDRILLPYGSRGAFGRDRQPSNHVLDGELLQLRSMSTLLPGIFLAVAAFLVNVVLSRLVRLQQPEIATLKALGYRDIEIGLHFLEFVLVVGLLGVVLGVSLGQWIGAAMVDLYSHYFKFPNLAFHLYARDAVVAVSISLAAAVTGAYGAVKRTVAMAPAEAMRPAAPARYRRSLVDRMRLSTIVGPSVQMVVREFERRPLRALLSVVAIAASTGLTVVAGFYYDGIRSLVETQFSTVMGEDAAVSFVEPRPRSSIRELAHLPGVLGAEGLRVVPVRFRAGHRHRDGALWGYPENIQMRRPRDRQGRPVSLPPDGALLTDILAKILGVGVGDVVQVEIQEGSRPIRSVVIAGVIDESFGLQGHMRLRALERLSGEYDAVSLALLRIDPADGDRLDARLKDMPFVAEVTRRSNLLARFEEQSGSMIVTISVIIALFAATITIGVVYNNARISLAARARDLASLRVLGFARSEISAILLGELFALVIVALPFGLLFGRWLVSALASTVDPETYRLPVLLTSRSYAFAAVVTLASALASALVVRRRIDQLDLVAVLKTRE